VHGAVLQTAPNPVILLPRSIYKGAYMVKLTTALVAGFSFAISSVAWAGCDEVKAKIEEKIKNKGVDKFTLTIVDKGAQVDGKVVGNCENEQKLIVYKKG
jgi:hypothetical protein